MRKTTVRPYTVPDYLFSAIQSLRPPDDITVSQWAEQSRVLDRRSSARSGPWRNSVTPYLIGIMDEFTNYTTEIIVVVKPTQIGGTEAILNILGYIVNQDPSPVMLVYPNDILGESVVEKRIKPMLRASPALSSRWDESGSKVGELRFKGMDVIVTGAGSPANLASHPIKVLLMDETDKFPASTRKEADPISLAKERTKSYDTSRKIFMASTPTTRQGQIWVAKEQCDCEKHYFVPCVHCGTEIELKMAQIQMPGKETGLSNKDRAARAVYVCQSCGAVITDSDKVTMLRNGRWKVVRQDAEVATSVCFWMNTLYSPFVRFAAIAAEWLKAQQDPDVLHNFVNSWLAEPWEEIEYQTDENLVFRRQTALAAFAVPGWCLLLTGGVDVQRKCAYWVIRAWGEGFTSQLIAHGQAINLEEASKAMDFAYSKRDGAQMLVDLALVDSSDQTDMVYDFCTRHSEWAMACKGSSTDMTGYFHISTVNKAGSNALGYPLCIVDTRKYKDMIASRMQRDNGPGSWMVYQGCDIEYAKQVTSEEKVTERNSRGNYASRWKPKPGVTDNHYLDCEVYAMCAADIQGVRIMGAPSAEIPPGGAALPEDTNDGWLRQFDDWL